MKQNRNRYFSIKMYHPKLIEELPKPKLIRILEI
jgi:hypothetical protein